jgi:molecular chaperone GrpE (heat shock protein)
MTEDSEEIEDNHISKVLQKGYKLHDKLIRPSMVAVVRK